MATAASTLYVTIDATGSQSGAATVNAQLNSIVNQSITVNNTLINMGRTSSTTTKKMATDFASLARYFKTFSKDMSGIAGIIAGFHPVNMFRSFIDTLITVNREYNSFLAMMTVTTGDVNKSAEAYQYVKGAAMAYGVEIKGLMKGYSQLSAATKGLMTELDTKRLFESVAAVTTVLHSTPQTVERIYNSLIQMASKGKVSMEELRQQFGEHVPGALQIGADAMGMTVKDFIDKVTKTGMSSVEFLKRLPDELFKRFGDAAELASKSVNASLNRAKTSIFDVFKDMSTNSMALGLGALFDSFTKQINNASPAFVTFSEIIGQALLKAAAFIDTLKPEDIKDFTDGVISAANGFMTFVGAVIELVKWIRKYSDEVLLGIEMLAILRFGVIGMILPLANMATKMLAVGGAVAVTGGYLASLATLLGALASFAAGWMFGEYLSKKFESVEQSGRMMATGFHAIVESVKYWFQDMSIAVPRFFVNMFEEMINSTNKFIAAISNLGADALSIIGIDAAKIKPIEFDFTSGYDREAKALEATHDATMMRIAKIDEEMRLDISAKHNTNKPKEIEASVLEQMGYSEKQIFEIKQRMLELQSLGTADPYDPNSDFANNKKDGKAKQNAILKRADDFVNSLKESYSTASELLKNSVEADEMTINEAFDAQVGMLKVFKDEQIAILLETISKTKDPESLKKLNADLFKTEQDYQQALTKLQRENLQQRKKEQDAANDALISSGVLKLSDEDKFLLKWASNEGRMSANAASGGDTDTVNKFESAKQAEIAKLRAADKSAVDSFFGTADDVWLAETTAKYEKMRELISSSKAFTVQQQADLISRLDSEMEFMTPTMNRIESTIVGSFDNMATAMAMFVRTGKADFGSLIQSMLADILKLEIKASMSNIWKSAGGLSGIIGSVFGSPAASGTGAGTEAVGSLFGAQVSGARALGGPVLAGKTYIVGEKGPERFTASSSGTITPNDQLGGTPPNVTVNVNNNMPDQAAVSAKPKMNNGQLEIEVMIQKIVASDLNRNGPITQGLSNTFGLGRSV